MSLFFLSVMLGLLCHRIAAAITPMAGMRSCAFGGSIKIEMSNRAYQIAMALLMTCGFLLVVCIVTLVVTEGTEIAPGFAFRVADVLISRQMGTAVFGFMVGILLSNLLTRIWKQSDYQFKSGDWLEIALIFALLLLGIGGEEFLRSAAQRISKVSLGTTTEISFAGPTPRQTRSSAEQPGGAFRNTDGRSGGSTGLQKLYDIGSEDRPNLKRDVAFIRILARYDKQIDPTNEQSWPLAEKILSPIGACLSGISQSNSDDTFLDEILSPMSQTMQDLAAQLDRPAGEIRTELSGLIFKMRVYAKARLRDVKQNDSRMSCNKIADMSDTDRDAALSDAAIQQFRDSADKLPYAIMASASVMAALEYYQAAAIAMDEWIVRKVRSEPKTVADKWYLLRARLTQTGFVDEWIRQRGAAASSWLRLYHIDNLKAIVDGIQAFEGITLLAQRNSDFVWSVGLLGASYSGDEGICSFPPLPRIDDKNPGADPDAEQQDLLRTIYDTYLSAQKDYVDHSLKHPVERVRAATIIRNNIDSLMKRNLRCIKTTKSLARAEHIERYVRSEMNMIDIHSATNSSDQIRDRMRTAEHLLGLGFQMIDKAVIDATEKRRRGTIQERIATDRTLETYETMLATRSQLREYSEREVTP